MFHQLRDDERGLTVRAEVVGAERTALAPEDLEFVATLLMAMAMTKRSDIDRARRAIADVVQGEGRWSH